MMKNDYRRSLIMLRPHAQGYSGHVRLERRTLMGTLYAVINAPNTGGTLCASLIRRDSRGNYIAVRLGELRRDGRGQASLAYSFDPRNIDGLTLEDYWLITIVHRDRAGRCSVVLSGNVNGSREADWDAVQAAACLACREERPLPPIIVPGRPAQPGEGPLGPQTPALPPQDQPAAPGEGPAGLPTPELPGDAPAAPEEGPVELPTPEVTEADGMEEPAPTFPEPDQPAFELPEAGTVFDEPVFAPAESTAAERLGLDPSVPWPGVSEQVRTYFAAQPEKELMLGDGHIYVSAPMPEGSGYDHVEVGLKLEEGLPVSTAYALPSRYTPEPPPGLEGYVWKGGAADGWWVMYTDTYTGERLM